MSYVVTDACIHCKYTDCVAICPVDAFREGPSMLVIDPGVCIDCGVCEPQCPAGAIAFDMDAPVRWRDLNRRYAAVWPAIHERKMPHAQAEEHLAMPGKFERFFMADTKAPSS